MHPLFSRGKGVERILPKKLLLDTSVPRLIWSQDSDVSHFLGLMAIEANQPSMNKMSVRRNRAMHIPSETPVCARKGNLLALSMHRGALQKANSLHEQGRRDAMSIKQIASVQTPENKQKHRLLLSALSCTLLG